MPAITINGVSIPIKGDSFAEQRAVIGDTFTRSVGGAMFSSFVARRRTFTFSTPPLESLTAEKYARLIEGVSQVWNFNSTSQIGFLSGSGVTNFLASGSATLVSSPTRGAAIAFSSLQLAASAGFRFLLSNKFGIQGGFTTTGSTPTGWTIMFWKNATTGADGVPSNGWYHYIASGTGSVTRGASANPAGVTQWRNGVSGSFGMGNMIEVSGSSTTGIWSYGATSGTGATSQFDDLVVWPFTLPTSWASGIYSYALGTSFAAAPVVDVSGDHLDGSTIKCFGRVEEVSHINATLPGSTSKPNVKVLNVTLEER